MKLIRLTLLVLLIAVASVATGCSGGSQQENSNAQQVQKADGSVVTKSELQAGFNLESRLFPEGEIEKVERLSRPDGTRKVLVYFRGNPSGTKGYTDPGDVDRAMDATPEEIKQALARATGGK